MNRTLDTIVHFVGLRIDAWVEIWEICMCRIQRVYWPMTSSLMARWWRGVQWSAIPLSAWDEWLLCGALMQSNSNPNDGSLMVLSKCNRYSSSPLFRYCSSQHLERPLHHGLVWTKKPPSVITHALLLQSSHNLIAHSCHSVAITIVALMLWCP